MIVAGAAADVAVTANDARLAPTRLEGGRKAALDVWFSSAVTHASRVGAKSAQAGADSPDIVDREGGGCFTPP